MADPAFLTYEEVEAGSWSPSTLKLPLSSVPHGALEEVDLMQWFASEPEAARVLDIDGVSELSHIRILYLDIFAAFHIRIFAFSN